MTMVEKIEIRRERRTRSTPTTAQARLLLLPGNPGVVSFYSAFARALLAPCRSALLHSVTLLGYVGHVGTNKAVAAPNTTTLTLPEQTAAARANVVRWIDAQPLESPLVIAGHSIGAHIACSIYTSLEPERRERIKAVALIFPAMEELATTQGGVQVAPFLASEYRVSIAVALARAYAALPRPLRRFLARKYLGRDGEQLQRGGGCVEAVGTGARVFDANAGSELTFADAVADATNATTVRSAISMARSEMAEVTSFDASVLHIGGEATIVSLFTNGDPWCPPRAACSLRAACAAISPNCCKVRELGRTAAAEGKTTAQHAFVRKAEHVDVVADELLSLLARAGLEVGCREVGLHGAPRLGAAASPAAADDLGVTLADATPHEDAAATNEAAAAAASAKADPTASELAASAVVELARSLVITVRV